MTFETDIEQKLAERNGRLIASDWTMLSDAPTDKTAWAAYRQKLRDLPTDPNWPNVQMPEAPEE